MPPVRKVEAPPLPHRHWKRRGVDLREARAALQCSPELHLQQERWLLLVRRRVEVRRKEQGSW